MTLFPERKPAPAVPAHLRWQYGEILHDDGETLKVWADVYELANGWTWSAKAHGYHREHDGTFRPVRQTEGGAAGCRTEDSARSECEDWIRTAVARLKISAAATREE